MQITFRHSKDPFYLYDVFSRSARQMFDPCMPRNRLESSDDKSLDVGDNTFEGRSNPEVTFLFGRTVFWWLAYAIAHKLVWVTAKASLAVLLLRYKPIELSYASFPICRPQPTAVCASDHALSKLSLLRKPLSAAVTSGKEVRKLESSCGASPMFVEKETSQLASVGESDSALPDWRQIS